MYQSPNGEYKSFAPRPSPTNIKAALATGAVLRTATFILASALIPVTLPRTSGVDVSTVSARYRQYRFPGPTNER